MLIVSSIPNYIDISNDNDTKEQEYIANLMMENLKKTRKFWKASSGKYQAHVHLLFSVLLYHVTMLQIWIQ